MRHWLTSAGLAAALTGSAMGQIEGDLSAPATAGLKPIDQAVGDMSANVVSQRRVESGLRVDGEQTSLFQLQQPVDLLQRPVYYRIGPGFRARTDRLDYLVLDKDDPGTQRRPNFALNQQPRVDGEFFEIIGPNTVFELALPHQSPFAPPPRVAPLPIPDARVAPVVDQRLDARVDGIIDGRLKTRVDPQLPGAIPASPDDDR